MVVIQEDSNNLIKLIQSVLTDDLRKKKYQGSSNKMKGHCYVASEALYHLLGGKGYGWIPQNIKHEGESHWFLLHESGRIIDVTSSQFITKVPTYKAIGRGFLTKQPSKRAKIVIDRLALTK